MRALAYAHDQLRAPSGCGHGDDRERASCHFGAAVVFVVAFLVLSGICNNYRPAADQSWTGALALIIVVMLLTFIARLGVVPLSRNRA